MPFEMDYSAVADWRTAELLDARWIRLAADPNALPNHPAIFKAGDLYGTGTSTKKIAHSGISGQHLPTAIADGASVTRTAVNTGSTTVAVGRRAKMHGATDLSKFTERPGGLITDVMFADDASRVHALAVMSALAQLMGGFSNSVGSTGVDLSVANVLAAMALLEVGYKSGIMAGQAMGLLHTVQGGDLRSALAATTGALQWKVPDGMLALRGNGFRGQYLDVDWFISDYCPTANAGADRAGGIFVGGGVVLADMSVRGDHPDQVVLGRDDKLDGAGKVLLGRARDEAAAITDWVSHSYFGVAEGVDAFGVAVITDA